MGDPELEAGLALAGMRAMSALKLRTTLTGLQRVVLDADFKKYSRRVGVGGGAPSNSTKQHHDTQLSQRYLRELTENGTNFAPSAK
jgi:hypothetical protein